uniref:ShKT domain-containing protein n=1 Tax=Acrobeloides nanus TaxID=290746 RepID=A0A914DVR6_9BILA
MFKIALFVGIVAAMFNSNLGQVAVACLPGGVCPSPATCNQATQECFMPGSTCTDANASCATWVPNGFCSSTYYTAAQKKQYCAKSCKLC